MRTLNLDIASLLMPLALAIAFVVYGLLSDRAITGGKPPTRRRKKTLWYGALFVLGAGYLALGGKQLGWPVSAWVLMMASWAVLLGTIAWWRSRNRTPSETEDLGNSGLTLRAAQAVGLLVCLIASAIEWQAVVQRQGRWWIALLWSLGAALVLVLARRNRRSTFLLALRGFVVLLFIGAVAEANGLVAISAGAGTLLLMTVERIWKTKDEPLPDRMN